MRRSEIDQRANDRHKVVFNRTNSRTQLENHAGIERVLAGCAIVDMPQSIGRTASDNRVELL